MNYHNITSNDMLNGAGLRVVLWVAGCSHHCKNCQNPITWDPNDGLPFEVGDLEEIYSILKRDYISGITFSGGDPLHKANRKAIREISRQIKQDFPNKTQWLYTGYTWEEIIQNVELLSTVSLMDVVVEGKYIEELNDIKYPWAGSTNQRAIDVSKSLIKGAPVLYSNE